MPLPHLATSNTAIEKVIYEVIDDTTAYLGKSPAGSSESASVWQIVKIVYDVNGGVQTTFSGGTLLYNYAWSDRLSLSYS